MMTSIKMYASWDQKVENHYELLSEGMLNVTPRAMTLDLKSLNLNSGFAFFPQSDLTKDSYKILLPHSLNEEI